MEVSKSKTAIIGFVAAISVPLSFHQPDVGRGDPKPVYKQSLGIVRTAQNFTTNSISLRYDLRNISGISGNLLSKKRSGQEYVNDKTPTSGIGSLQLNAFLYAAGKDSIKTFGIQDVMTIRSELLGRGKYVVVPDSEIYNFNNIGAPSPFSTSIKGPGKLYGIGGISRSLYEYISKPLLVGVGDMRGSMTMSEHIHDGQVIVRFAQDIDGKRFVLDRVTIGNPGQFQSALIISYPKSKIELEAGYVGGDYGKAFIPISRGFYERLNIYSASGPVRIVPVSHRSDINTYETAIGLSAANATKDTVLFRNTLDNALRGTISRAFHRDMEILKLLRNSSKRHR